MRSRLRLTLPLTVALALGGAQPALADPGGLSCGSDVHQDVELQRDLACSGTALIVKADGVTIDLNGHTIRYVGGDATGTGLSGIHSDEDSRLTGVGNMLEDITVRNGSITGFPRAVDLSYVSGATVERVRTDGGVLFFRGNDARLSRSTVGGVGIGERVIGATGPSRIDKNRINGEVLVFEYGGVEVVDNDIRPVADQDGVAVHYSSGVQVRNNRVKGGADGIMFQFSSGEIRGNTVQGSTVGVHVSYSGATVRDNKVIGARREGILLETDSPFARGELRGNRVVSAGGDGVRVEATHPAGITVSRNHARGGRGHGINAPGVTDGGGNRATGNRTAPQCIGVVCK